MKKSITLALLICCLSTTINSTEINSNFHRTKNLESTHLNEIGWKYHYSEKPNTLTAINSFQYFGTEDLRPKFRIGFNAPQIDHRQILLTIDENTTDGFDWGYDAEIYEIFGDDMYWLIDQKKYVIQGTNSVFIGKEIPLGIITVEGGLITIGVDGLENQIEGIRVGLIDKELNITYDIHETNYQVTLPPGEYHNRFFITFISSETNQDDDSTGDDTTDNDTDDDTTEDEIVDHQFLMYVNNGNNTINIKNKEHIFLNSIVLYNNLGQVSQIWNKYLSQERLSLPIHVKKGIYILRAFTEKGIITKRVHINYK